MWRAAFPHLSNGAGFCHGSVETGTVFPADLLDKKGSKIYAQNSAAAFIQNPALVMSGVHSCVDL